MTDGPENWSLTNADQPVATLQNLSTDRESYRDCAVQMVTYNEDGTNANSTHVTAQVPAGTAATTALLLGFCALIGVRSVRGKKRKPETEQEASHE